MEVTKAHFDLCVAWIKEEITLSQLSYALELNPSGRDGLVAIAIILKESYYKHWFHLLTPLSQEERDKRLPPSPESLIGALQDNIKTDPMKFKSAKSRKVKGLS